MSSGSGAPPPSLSDVLDGRAEPVLSQNGPLDVKAGQGEPLVDGVPVSKAFRHREKMLLQAVVEKYGEKLGKEVSAESLVAEFLGESSEDKIGKNSDSYTARGALDIDTEMETNDEASSSNSAEDLLANIIDRAKYVPLRLTLPERKLLRLCEATLNVSEYTDKVDILTWKSKTGRIHEQIRDICAILSGLAIAADYEVGQKMIKDRTFEDNAEFFAMVFEIGRRHKILNPECMRTDYGKLIHMLMDSQHPDIQRLLEFNFVRKVRTVYDFLADKQCLELLKSPEIVVATTAIVDRNRSRGEVQQAIRVKEAAVKRLIHKFSSDNMSDEEIEWCLYSIGDNSSFLVFNRDPVDHMIEYLEANFPPTLANDHKRSLAIRAGSKGARLSHGHSQQYQYALQSLTLWREIQNDMFKLWCLAEEDLLDSGNYYSLRDTGQGLNRVQSAPRIGRAMHEILHRAQKKVGSWIGSSVVHLGDHNVPNALMFIDKYTQVPRILNPIVNVIDSIPRLAEDKTVAELMERNCGSIKDCQLDILQDFFKHAFDGSGADNFYDAGSCIDGRLTSAWNWCNKLDKKSYYPIFKLAGFTGFDGSFKN
eukprot:TRINITY_DN1889_c0_g1_i15.p1 TRINITY_DN1889_c0_g1~~TRINITY_DN1889_c0_g1_i15.p1  ORF type:complete len:593 (-),score=122.50 TRINITY_DN1889_c0_g1_i15:501-2279(-)